MLMERLTDNTEAQKSFLEEKTKPCHLDLSNTAFLSPCSQIYYLNKNPQSTIWTAGLTCSSFLFCKMGIITRLTWQFRGHMLRCVACRRISRSFLPTLKAFLQSLSTFSQFSWLTDTDALCASHTMLNVKGQPTLGFLSHSYCSSENSSDEVSILHLKCCIL